ncbi:hypothetical protein CYLTODRAFT_160691 [Cylindrobasidium torrendii FP15055 ss-10]|uniref:Uncharacterized protein n=1 Tax=Cylindrobasidium torrendii FP15055 ss-10 TaxID=1314674 RepID=A0A0D7BL81_9AGAR|nr:hypothetical protein CYLTODRAFT_160691 [Cylindrobasidium torrendii FP15055 ss-10]
MPSQTRPLTLLATGSDLPTLVTESDSPIVSRAHDTDMVQAPHTPASSQVPRTVPNLNLRLSHRRNSSAPYPVSPLSPSYAMNHSTHSASPRSPLPSPYSQTPPRTPTNLQTHSRHRTVGGDSGLAPFVLDSSSTRVPLHAPSHSRSSSRSHSPAPSLSHAHPETARLLDTLKNLRAQNALLTRSLRDKHALERALESERIERSRLEEDLARAEHSTSVLAEHNRLISHHPHSPAAEAQILPVDPDSVAELQTSRAQLEAAFIEKARMEERIESLHHEMQQCLDSSANALQVERELRAEVLGRLAEREEECARLKVELRMLKMKQDKDNHSPRHSTAFSTSTASSRSTCPLTPPLQSLAPPLLSVPGTSKKTHRPLSKMLSATLLRSPSSGHFKSDTTCSVSSSGWAPDTSDFSWESQRPASAVLVSCFKTVAGTSSTAILRPICLMVHSKEYRHGLWPSVGQGFFVLHRSYIYMDLLTPLHSHNTLCTLCFISVVCV